MYRYISELGFRTPAIINSLKIFIRDFKDVPSVSVTKLNSEQIYSALEIHSLPWKTSSDSSKLTKEFKFNSFKETFAFMGSISTICDEMHHYPKWTQKENVVTVEMTTPECSGVSVKDVLLAYTMEQYANEVSSIVQNNQKYYYTQITSVCDGPKVVDQQILQLEQNIHYLYKIGTQISLKLRKLSKVFRKLQLNFDFTSIYYNFFTLFTQLIQDTIQIIIKIILSGIMCLIYFFKFLQQYLQYNKRKVFIIKNNCFYIKMLMEQL